MGASRSNNKSRPLPLKQEVRVRVKPRSNPALKLSRQQLLQKPLRGQSATFLKSVRLEEGSPFLRKGAPSPHLAGHPHPGIRHQVSFLREALPRSHPAPPRAGLPAKVETPPVKRLPEAPVPGSPVISKTSAHLVAAAPVRVLR